MSTLTGVAWYDASEWKRLRALVPDPEKLEATHAEWLAFAEKGVADLRAAGHEVRRVPVRVGAFQAWCELLGRHPDASARAEYTSAELQRLHKAGLLDHGT
jgi:Asp-tRNA(Asn)/Glu-tRNA(Gln) amidotransferase A subunit family amidase